MSHLSWLEAAVIGALQGVSELVPVSSLGHSVLLPALVGGSWARDLDVSAPESPYLAFIVGLHVATALALLCFYWRDWVRIVRGLATSIARREILTAEQRLGWLLVAATIPVGLAGLLLEHTFRVVLSKPVPVAAFLALNGLVLLGAEVLRRRAPARSVPTTAPTTVLPRVDTAGGGRASGTTLSAPAAVSEARLAAMPLRRAVAVGAAQIAALCPGISRSGVTMAAGLLRGWITRTPRASPSCSPHRSSSRPGSSSWETSPARSATASARRSSSAACCRSSAPSSRCAS